MNQFMEFGKRYGKWIAAGVVATVVAVGSVVAYKAYNEGDEDYAEVEETETDAVESEQTEEG